MLVGSALHDRPLLSSQTIRSRSSGSGAADRTPHSGQDLTMHMYKNRDRICSVHQQLATQAVRISSSSARMRSLRAPSISRVAGLNPATAAGSVAGEALLGVKTNKRECWAANNRAKKRSRSGHHSTATSFKGKIMPHVLTRLVAARGESAREDCSHDCRPMNRDT